MASYHIRGGLGTQIISVMMAYAMAIENKETVDTLYFNYGNYFNPLTKDINIWFIDDVLYFKTKKPDVVSIAGQEKINISSISNIALLAKNIEEVRKNLRPRLYFQTRKTLLHMRGLDRALVRPDTYKKFELGEKPDLVLTDDDKLEGQTGDPVKDWRKVLTARRVIGGYSNYTISCALLNPKQTLEIIGKDYSWGGDEKLWKAVDKLVDCFPNIGYYNENR
jgi:hypothetical protein